MRRYLIFALFLCCIWAPVHAQSPIDGKWRFAPKATHVSGIEYDIALQDGIFTCRWCKPQWSAPADGNFHPVAGQQGFDEASVNILDHSTVVFTRKKNGRFVYQAVDVISPDTTVMTFFFTEVNEQGKVETGTGLWSRLTPKPLDAHPVTGRWRESFVRASSDDEVSLSITSENDHIRIEFAPDEFLKAKLGGPPVRIVGDRRGIMASLTQADQNGFVQTDYLDGEIISVTTFSLVDPAQMEIVVKNMRNGSRSSYVARKD